MEVLFPGLSSALNVHPLFVHFPIVLWLTALLFWGLALWLERVDPSLVRAEITEARRYFAEIGWPVIDVTRRSIEETAAAVLSQLARHVEAKENSPELAGRADGASD